MAETLPSWKALTRRTVLGGLAAAIGGAGLGLTASSAAAARDYSTQGTYDWLLATVGPASAMPNRSPANELGTWAWQLSPILRTYPLAYRAWGESRYLDALIADADLLLSERDSVRGVTDYRGLSLPNWRQGGTYTTGSVAIPGTSAAPVLRLRTGYTGPADGTRGTVRVSAGSAPDLFTLLVTMVNNSTSQYVDLSLDPSSANYVVPRLYWDSPNAARATAVDLRDVPAAGQLPAFGTFPITTDFHYNLVDTGVLVQALAEFAAIVKASSVLRRSRPSSAVSGRSRVTDYDAKADEYIPAATAALAVHDFEWRENSSGEAWYVLDPDGPQGWAGADRPHNQNIAIAAAYLHLANATGNPAFRDRAAKLFRRFKNDLIVDANGAYIWYYNHRQGRFFTGWTAADHVSDRIPYARGYQPIEDIGHGILDLACASVAAKNAVVIDDIDMQRFAATFTENIATRVDGKAQVALSVDGTGVPRAFDTRAGGFGLLRPWSQAAYDFALEIYNVGQQAAGRASIAESIGTLTTYGSGNL